MNASLPRLYLISPGRHAQDFDLIDAARSAFEGGARLLLVREPHLKDKALTELVDALLEVARPHDASLVLNAGKGEGMRVARKLKLAVHLGPAWPVAGVRKELQGLSVSASTRDAESMALAIAGKADFLTLGPVFPAAAASGAGLGIEGLRALLVDVPVPVFVMGGITPETIPSVLDAGAYGVVAMGYVFDTPEPPSDPIVGSSENVLVPSTPADRVRRLLEAFPREPV